MKKMVPLDNYIKANELTNKYGIETLNSCMIGLPGETEETVKKTLKFLREHPEVRQANISIAVPYPGTELYEMAKKGKANFLILLNNKIPDGLDVSWIWDVNFKPILDVANNIFVAGDRVYDVNLRLRYEGSKNNINTFEDLSEAVDAIVKKTKEGEKFYVLPTYSAMLDVRKILLGRKLL